MIGHGGQLHTLPNIIWVKSSLCRLQVRNQQVSRVMRIKPQPSHGYMPLNTIKCIWGHSGRILSIKLILRKSFFVVVPKYPVHTKKNMFDLLLTDMMLQRLCVVLCICVRLCVQSLAGKMRKHPSKHMFLSWCFQAWFCSTGDVMNFDIKLELIVYQNYGERKICSRFLMTFNIQVYLFLKKTIRIDIFDCGKKINQ